MAEDRTPHLSIKDSGGVYVVQFADRKILDELSISEIGDELYSVVSQNETPQLLLSFKNVEHLSSAALGMLIKLNKQVADRSGTLKLSDISPPIFEVFKITRLNRMFDIHDTAARALESF